MKNNKFDKLIIIILICVCIYLFLSNLNKKEDTYYHIDSLPHEICGEEIYITDFTSEPPNKKELNIKELLNEIEYICKKSVN